MHSCLHGSLPLLRARHVSFKFKVYSHRTRSKAPCCSNRAMHTVHNQATRNAMSHANLGPVLFVHIVSSRWQSIKFCKIQWKCLLGEFIGSCGISGDVTSTEENFSCFFVSFFNIFLEMMQVAQFQGSYGGCTLWMLCGVCQAKASFMPKCRNSKHTQTTF